MANVAAKLGIDLNHHNALSDAEAATEIMLMVWRDSGMPFNEWLEGWRSGAFSRQKRKRQQKNVEAKYTGDGEPSGIFAGEVVVFTGAAGIARKQLADTAKRLGIAVKGSVTKDTTMLVSGTQDSGKIKGKMSSKQRRAAQLIAEGQDIRVMPPSDFFDLVKTAEEHQTP